jgi:DNA (cytosine-5)-methyltransferase 1
LAWHRLGWQPQFFSEIEPFCCRLLQHHFPSVPNLGDLTKFKDWSDDIKLDLLVGGTPCQAFSVAGLRQGLADPRGNLALVFLGLLDKYRPRWVVWENVPGVLSSSGGRDFGAFLGALAELGYGFCYRVLNAQHFGVPQRRRRVFVVGHFGDWRRAAAVLFERPSVRGDSTTGGRALPAASSSSVGESDPIAFNWMEARCFHAGPVTNPLRAKHIEAVFSDRPRRFTPRECERLQGMPDDWTLIPGASNTARYKAIGNSMAVPVMRWIGEGIAAVETLP